MLNYSVKQLLFNLLRLFLCFILLSEHQRHSQGVNAELLFTPLWRSELNNFEFCHFDYSNESGQTTFTLNGHPSLLCSLQMVATNDSATLIQITQSLSATDVFYIERQSTECVNKIVRIDGNGGPCSAVVFENQFQLNLEGNFTLLISDVHVPSPQNDQPRCAGVDEDITASIVSQTKPVCHKKEYTDVYTCSHKDERGRCHFRSFPSDCNATLGYREVTFQCSDLHQNKKSFIYYPGNMTRVYYNHSNVISCDANIFQDLPNLEIIYIDYNDLTEVNTGLFGGIKKLRWIDLESNELMNLDSNLFQYLPVLWGISIAKNQLTTLQTELFSNLNVLERLRLQYNRLEVLYSGIFRDLHNLTRLDLSHNRLVTLPANIFHELHNLNVLYMQNNNIIHLDSHTFQNLVKLQILLLAYNELAYVDIRLFENMDDLTFLDLSDNMLHSIPQISHLYQLNHLNLEGNLLQKANIGDFSGLQQPAEIFVSQPEICLCYIPSGVNCSSSISRSPYITCDRLLSDRVLVVFMWLIALSAISGNIFVLWWRNTHATKHTVQSKLLLNLAMSDLLMGIYMSIIASADIHFGENFPLQAETWRIGVTCRIAGVLSILSSEASVFFVTLISIDRFISIKYPYTSYKLGKISTNVAVVMVWMFTGLLGVVPAILSGQNTDIYDNSHVCIGIPLALVTSYSTHSVEKTLGLRNSRFYDFQKTFTHTKHLGSEPGMYFATAVFIGLNSLCYLIILGCYIEVLRAVYKASKQNGLNQEMKEQLRLTARVTAIVGTDFLCWFPIIILGICVQTEIITLPPSVFAWSVTFILPLNSAINPYLYTITDLVNWHRKQNQQPDNSVVTHAIEEGQEGGDKEITLHVLGDKVSAEYIPNRDQNNAI